MANNCQQVASIAADSAQFGKFNFAEQIFYNLNLIASHDQYEGHHFSQHVKLEYK